MPSRRHRLRLVPDRLAICRLEAGKALPAWVGCEAAVAGDSASGFLSVTWTSGEISIVCPEARMPQSVRRSTGWQALEVEGPLEFDEIGVLAGLARPLAEARLSLFTLSTHDTDYLLVRSDDLEAAASALAAAGHRVVTAWNDSTPRKGP